MAIIKKVNAGKVEIVAEIAPAPVAVMEKTANEEAVMDKAPGFAILADALAFRPITEEEIQESIKSYFILEMTPWKREEYYHNAVAVLDMAINSDRADELLTVAENMAAVAWGVEIRATDSINFRRRF